MTGFTGDYVIKYLTKKNKGTYEPEFRLVFMIPACFACGLGMFLFGYTMAIGAAAEVCSFLQGVMMVGVLIGIFSSLTYGLDSFRNQSNEIFVMNMLFKVSTQPGMLERHSCFSRHVSNAILTCDLPEFHVLRPV